MSFFEKVKQVIKEGVRDSKPSKEAPDAKKPSNEAAEEAARSVQNKSRSSKKQLKAESEKGKKSHKSYRSFWNFEFFRDSKSKSRTSESSRSSKSQSSKKSVNPSRKPSEVAESTRTFKRSRKHHKKHDKTKEGSGKAHHKASKKTRKAEHQKTTDASKKVSRVSKVQTVEMSQSKAANRGSKKTDDVKVKPASEKVRKPQKQEKAEAIINSHEECYDEKPAKRITTAKSFYAAPELRVLEDFDYEKYTKETLSKAKRHKTVIPESEQTTSFEALNVEMHPAVTKFHASTKVHKKRSAKSACSERDIDLPDPLMMQIRKASPEQPGEEKVSADLQFEKPGNNADLGVERPDEVEADRENEEDAEEADSNEKLEEVQFDKGNADRSRSDE
ncbi:hypothetical protein L596_013018 [Steinernema carpocapsae]|uniref:Uncharacterized protein n=1 Tax=Steinernema carpocapsae TaxID=34508 RepID=A0A4U5NYU7_STECR|nr:hypothetical protein L596_013018 [Steinernema carpocapsae]